MTETLICTQIQLQDRRLLIPRNLMADIAPLGGLIVESHREKWVLGHKYWRNRRIPVVCFETLAGGSLKKHSETACILVFNRCSEQEGVEFWGLLVQASPQDQEITADALVSEPGEPSEAELAAVRLQGELASVPDMAYVEARLAEATASL